MKHPGTFNANPLSAAAGITALKLVAGGEPCRQANHMGQLLRQRLNELFAAQDVPWVAYGQFSGFKLLPGYSGPRPSSDDFVPYAGNPDLLEKGKSSAMTHTFRRAMLLQGVDLPGLGGMTSAAHTEADIDQTVAAAGEALSLLQ
jgi:glutamate-1-semialdehyde 2,1-aminomutase